jgi:DNA repair protein RecO
VELLARGVKKIVSKNASHLEPGALVLVDAVRGKELEYITTVQPIAFFPRIWGSIEKLSAARVAVAFIDKMTAVGDRDVNLFKESVRWFAYIEKVEQFLPIFLDGFIVTSLCAVGFTPRLDVCVVCQKTFQGIGQEAIAGKPVGIYFAGGGLVCAACVATKKAIGEDVASCALPDVSNFQLLLKSDWRLLEHYPVPPQEAEALHQLVYAFATYHTEKQLVDWGRIWYTVGSMSTTVNNNVNNNRPF